MSLGFPIILIIVKEVICKTIVHGGGSFLNPSFKKIINILHGVKPSNLNSLI
jgi:hypothetical protein